MHLTRHRRQGGQQGYIMMALLLAVSLVLIALAAGLPTLSAEIKRRREEELIHRGVQYTRAIKKYYRKFGRYPLSVDDLEDSNHVRFLRKRYKDPITNSDFRLLHLGEVQLYFSAPGAGPTPGAAPPPGVPLPPGADTSSGAPAAAAPAGWSGTFASDITQSSSSPSPFVPLSAMGANGTFGGGPIMGVASNSDKQSFHVFNDKDHYKDWQFVYSPALDHGLFTHPFDGTRDLLGIRNAGSPPARSTGIDTRPTRR